MTKMSIVDFFEEKSKKIETATDIAVDGEGNFIIRGEEHEFVYLASILMGCFEDPAWDVGVAGDDPSLTDVYWEWAHHTAHTDRLAAIFNMEETLSMNEWEERVPEICIKMKAAIAALKYADDVDHSRFI